MNKTALAFLIVITASQLAYGARPLSVEDAGTVAKGAFEIESGSILEESKNKDFQSVYYGQVKAGILDNLDIGVAVPYLTMIPCDDCAKAGVGDASTAVKFRVLKETEVAPSVALKAGAGILTGNREKGLGDGVPNYSATAVATKSFGDLFAHLNFGYSAEQNEPVNSSFWGIAAQKEVAAGLNVLAEVTGQTDTDEDGSTSYSNSLVGINYLVMESMVLDAGLNIPLSEESPGSMFTFGLTWTI
jgi:hypothetical protein